MAILAPCRDLLRHLKGDGGRNGLAVVGEGFVAVGIEANGDFVLPWGDVGQVQPRAINSPLFFAIDIKMSVAHVGLVGLVNLLWGKAKVGNLYLQVPAPYRIGMHDKVHRGNGLPHRNLQGVVAMDAQPGFHTLID